MSVAETMPAKAAKIPSADELIAHLVAVNLDSDANPVAEIEEIIWIDVLKPHSVPLAPLVTESITPISRNTSSLT